MKMSKIENWTTHIVCDRCGAVYQWRPYGLDPVLEEPPRTCRICGNDLTGRDKNRGIR